MCQRMEANGRRGKVAENNVAGCWFDGPLERKSWECGKLLWRWPGHPFGLIIDDLCICMWICHRFDAWIQSAHQARQRASWRGCRGTKSLISNSDELEKCDKCLGSWHPTVQVRFPHSLASMPRNSGAIRGKSIWVRHSALPPTVESEA
jgi:hypothetical protein